MENSKSAHQPFSLSPIKIGRAVISPALILAPMSGVTNIGFRRLIRELNPGSVGMTVTEFISVEGLTRLNRQSLKMMEYAPEERPISIQIFGYDLERMTAAAKMVEDSGADIVDINSGCPVPKVVKRGGGCELMRQPAHLARVLESIRKAVSIPVTVKIRAGWDDTNRNAIEVARILRDSGIDMLAVHGRTRTEMYRGQADWNLVGEVARTLSCGPRPIPVVGSGDVICGGTAAERLNSGVAGLMIGRAAISNPWVFSEIAASLAGRPFERPADIETPRVIRRYIALLRESLPDKAVLGRVKQFASQVTRRVPGAQETRKALCTAANVGAALELLLSWEDELAATSDQSRRSRGNFTHHLGALAGPAAADAVYEQPAAGTDQAGPSAG